MNINNVVLHVVNNADIPSCTGQVHHQDEEPLYVRGLYNTPRCSQSSRHFFSWINIHLGHWWWSRYVNIALHENTHVCDITIRVWFITTRTITVSNWEEYGGREGEREREREGERERGRERETWMYNNVYTHICVCRCVGYIILCGSCRDHSGWKYHWITIETTIIFGDN